MGINVTAELPRVAIVTGAARGIGAATAKRLAADGFAVAVLDLDESATKDTVTAIEAAGGSALGVGVDVADATAVTAAVTRVADELGDGVVAVHLRGAFLMSRAVQQYMTTVKWGRIVNLSSTSALGNRGQANYSAAKAGLQGFTRALAIELGKFGVTVNAVAPGFIVTDMTAQTAALMGVSFEDMQSAAAATIPVGRVGRPEDVANAISYLVSDGASFVSGQVLYVAGGPAG